jgi:hypothetical protein
MQHPSLAPASRRDENHRAGRCAENRCRHTAKRTPPKIRPNLGAHHDHSGVAFSGRFDDFRRSCTGSMFDYEAGHIFARQFHTRDQRGRC